MDVHLDGAELLSFYYCGTADNSTHYSAKTASGAHGGCALQHVTDAQVGHYVEGGGHDRYVC